MNATVTYHRASTDEDLEAILGLQAQNVTEVLSSQEQQDEGFVTVHHDFDILKQMNTACAHCIAKHNGEVVGYVLCMLQDFKNSIPVLIPTFREMDDVLEEKGLSSLEYIVMGQVCIAKNYRGQGVFRGLYKFMSEVVKNEFDAIITEVDIRNTRSSQAHFAIGFELLKTYGHDGQIWELIILKTKD